MKNCLSLALVLCPLSSFLLLGAPAAKPQPAAVPATGAAAKIEQMVKAVLPEEKIDRMAGFFAPVVKRYQPTMQKFQREWATAQAKIPVLVKYLPKADEALAEARKMKVPAKYEQEKEGYLNQLETLLTMTKTTLALASSLSNQKGTK